MGGASEMIHREAPDGMARNEFERAALSHLGGLDPRAMENGTPDFNDPMEQIRLAGQRQCTRTLAWRWRRRARDCSRNSRSPWPRYR